MSLHLLNLVLRFILEMTALVGIGMWGWNQTDGWMRFIAAIGLPMIAATIWGVFNVPGDPSRSGNAPVVVPGIVRLLIEAVFFACGALTFFALAYDTFAATFAVIVLVHYVAAINRVLWLVRR